MSPADKGRNDGLHFKDQCRDTPHPPAEDAVIVPVVNAEHISESQISTEREEEVNMERERRLQAEKKQKMMEKELEELRNNGNEKSLNSSHGSSNTQRALLIGGLVVGIIVVIAVVGILFLTVGRSSNENSAARFPETNLRSSPTPVPSVPESPPVVAPQAPQSPPSPAVAPQPVQRPTSYNYERSNISIGYLGDPLGCILNISFVIGGERFVPIGNPYYASVLSGNQPYSIDGFINCPTGSCIATGSGRINVQDFRDYFLIWSYETCDVIIT